MLAAGLGHSRETRQAIGDDSRPGCNMVLSPACNGFCCESTYTTHPHADRSFLFIEFHGCNEGDLVLRSTTSLATTELTAKISIINLHESSQ
jgi:hypothetical protein